MNTTVRIKASQIYKDWHVIDAAGRPLGRVASEAAILLRGKHKPTFEPHLDDGDFVIIVNASQVKVTGRKRDQMAYYSHSGYPGGLRRVSYAGQMERFPDRIIRAAVEGMLPGGPLGEAMARHLKIYAGPNHPHASQVTGSERARALRADLAAAALLEERKPARLRPLSVPDVAPEPVAKAAPAAPPAKRVRKAAEAPAAQAAPAPPAVETPTAEAAATEAPKKRAPRAKVEAAAPEAAVAEAPKARAPRKKAEPAAAEATAEAAASESPAKPARRRAAPKQEE